MKKLLLLLILLLITACNTEDKFTIDYEIVKPLESWLEYSVCIVVDKNVTQEEVIELATEYKNQNSSKEFICVPILTSKKAALNYNSDNYDISDEWILLISKTKKWDEIQYQPAFYNLKKERLRK